MGKIKKKQLIEKWRHKYRISVLNEFTLEEAFFFRISRPRFLLWSFIGIGLLFTLFTILFLYTPLKKLTPGYSDMIVRSELIQETIRLDSIYRLVEIQKQQAEAIKGILSGEIAIDSVLNSESKELKIIGKDFLSKTEREQEFCEEYEEREKYNLSSIEEKKAEHISLFFKPIKGVISKKFNPKMKHYGCDLAASLNETVVSIFNGTVVFSEYTTNADFVIGILHENEFFSIYKYNAKVFKNVGDKVKTGEVIAIVSASGGEDSSKPYLHFELWQKGVPVNPEEYIIF